MRQRHKITLTRNSRVILHSHPKEEEQAANEALEVMAALAGLGGGQSDEKKLECKCFQVRDGILHQLKTGYTERSDPKRGWGTETFRPHPQKVINEINFRRGRGRNRTALRRAAPQYNLNRQMDYGNTRRQVRSFFKQTMSFNNNYALRLEPDCSMREGFKSFQVISGNPEAHRLNKPHIIAAQYRPEHSYSHKTSWAVAVPVRRKLAAWETEDLTRLFKQRYDEYRFDDAITLWEVLAKVMGLECKISTDGHKYLTELKPNRQYYAAKAAYRMMSGERTINMWKIYKTETLDEAIELLKERKEQ
jgi:hypothetical protein